MLKKLSPFAIPLLLIFVLVAVAVMMKNLFRSMADKTADFFGMGKKDEGLNAEAQNPHSPWKPPPMNSVPDTDLTFSQAEAMAIKLYDAIGYFTNDFSAVTGVIYSLKSKAQLAYVTKVFRDRYDYDLFTYLRGNMFFGLDDDQMTLLNNYVNSLR